VGRRRPDPPIIAPRLQQDSPANRYDRIYEPYAVGEAFRIEARALRELPIVDFDTSEQTSPRVDSKALDLILARA
jgi:hypothetical protein